MKHDVKNLYKTIGSHLKCPCNTKNKAGDYKAIACRKRFGHVERMMMTGWAFHHLHCHVFDLLTYLIFHWVNEAVFFQIQEKLHRKSQNHCVLFSIWCPERLLLSFALFVRVLFLHSHLRQEHVWFLKRKKVSLVVSLWQVSPSVLQESWKDNEM